MPAARQLILLALAVTLASCSDQPLFLSLAGTGSDIQVTSVTDGQVVAKGSTLPLLISSSDSSRDRTIEVEVTLTSSSGEVVVQPVRTSATLNQQTSIALPSGLAPGLYRLDLVVYSNGETAQKKSSTFFVAPDGLKIMDITSFPPLVSVRSSVMLKADVQYPEGTNPWLRWSWKGKPIASGLLSGGYDQVLWTAPADEGVYAITLEMFPFPPADGTDFAFSTSLQLTTNVFVSTGKAQAKGDLGPESSYLVLLHMDGNLADAGTGAAANGAPKASPVGKPRVVSLQDGFGYRLDGTDGIKLPWLGLPVDGGKLQPFTLSLGVSFDDPASAGTVVIVRTADAGFGLTVTMNGATKGPDAVLSLAGSADFPIPWKGPALEAGKRVLLSLSIVPQQGSTSAQWFLDGLQVSSASAPLVPTVLRQSGSLLIGGDKGFKGIVDELGIYTTDAAGHPSPDPDLYLKACQDQYGSLLVFAAGFDGTDVPSGFTLQGPAQVSAGAVVLKPEAGLGLPAIAVDGTGAMVTATLAADSGRTATLQAAWDGGGPAIAPVSLSGDSGAFQFGVSGDGRSLLVAAGTTVRTLALSAPPAGGARLILTLVNPANASNSLSIDRVVALWDHT